MKIIQRKDAKTVGSAFYYTGKPCINGHVDKRYTSTGNCVTCLTNHRKSEKYKIVAKKNRRRPEVVERNRIYATSDAGKNVRNIRNARPEQRLKKKKYDSSIKNKPDVIKRKRLKGILYRSDPSIKKKASNYGKQYAKSAHGKAVRAAHESKRRLKRNGQILKESKIHHKIRTEIYKRAQHLSKTSNVNYHVDHIVPLQHTETPGLENVWNLQIITESDNLRKGNRREDELDFAVHPIDISDILSKCPILKEYLIGEHK